MMLSKNIVTSPGKELIAKADKSSGGEQSCEVKPGEYDAYYGFWSGGQQARSGSSAFLPCANGCG
jgi:nitrous oxide reductase